MNTKMTKKDVATSAADANEEQQKKIWQLNKKKKHIMSWGLLFQLHTKAKSW